jgi:hypothetical protein
MRDVPPPSKTVDVILYLSAAVTYIVLSLQQKFFLNWIVGPFWLLLWVWGIPAFVRLCRRQPVFPRRGPDRPTVGGADE